MKLYNKPIRFTFNLMVRFSLTNANLCFDLLRYVAGDISSSVFVITGIKIGRPCLRYNKILWVLTAVAFIHLGTVKITLIVCLSLYRNVQVQEPFYNYIIGTQRKQNCKVVWGIVSDTLGTSETWPQGTYWWFQK